MDHLIRAGLFFVLSLAFNVCIAASYLSDTSVTATLNDLDDAIKSKDFELFDSHYFNDSKLISYSMQEGRRVAEEKTYAEMQETIRAFFEDADTKILSVKSRDEMIDISENGEWATVTRTVTKKMKSPTGKFVIREKMKTVFGLRYGQIKIFQEYSTLQSVESGEGLIDEELE